MKKTSQDGLVTEEANGRQGRLWDFDIEGHNLKKNHVAFLDKLIQQMKANPKQKWIVVIGGTSDTLGKGKYDNQALSERRAKAAADYIRNRLPKGANVEIDTKGFGDEPAAAKDATGTRDDWFRAVDVALTIPNAPRPHRPKVLPNKNKPIPRPERPVLCLTDSECPSSNRFEVQLDLGASGGEVAELALYIFRIRDTKNNLTAAYKLRAAGVGVPSPIPGSVSIMGKPSPFSTTSPVRVTRFGPIASFFSGTLPPPHHMVSIGLLRLAYRPDGTFVPRIRPFINVDTGPISIPGAGVHGGILSLQTECRGVDGARKG